jgi:hypothetical protein
VHTAEDAQVIGEFGPVVAAAERDRLEYRFARRTKRTVVPTQGSSLCPSFGYD